MAELIEACEWDCGNIEVEHCQSLSCVLGVLSK